MKVKPDKFTRDLVKKAFPDYNGRKYRVKVFEGPKEIRSYWSEGSRDFYAFINMETKEAGEIHSNHPVYEPNQPNTLKELPINVALICHTIFCGKDIGVTIYVRPENMPLLLGKGIEQLAQNMLEKIV